MRQAYFSFHCTDASNLNQFRSSGLVLGSPSIDFADRGDSMEPARSGQSEEPYTAARVAHNLGLGSCS